MPLCLESFSTELYFEIFDQLYPFDLFQAFLGLNHRLNGIVGSYPLQLDFRSMVRSKFDFVCRHIRPNQVVSLILSEEKMPDQVQLFMQYFPGFKQQFTRLHKVNFFRTATFISDLPCQVSSLSFKSCLIKKNVADQISPILAQQANVLTRLTVDRVDVFQSIDISFPLLTHLNIARDVVLDIYSMIAFSRWSIVDLNSIVERLRSSITHLNFNIDENNEMLDANLEHLSHSLTHLQLTFSEEMNVSFHSLEQCLIPLSHLTHLTIQATGSLDLFDGCRWEELLSKTSIIKFNFKFTLTRNINWNQNKTSILDTFRSRFWLEKKCWYVVCQKEIESTSVSVYSVPRFSRHYIVYPESIFPILSTVPLREEQRLFYDINIDTLMCFVDDLKITSTHRFARVNRLVLFGPKLPSIDTLISFVDLGQIQRLYILSVTGLSADELQTLLHYFPRLYHLELGELPSSFIAPPHIRSLELHSWDVRIPIEVFFRAFPRLENLIVPFESKELMATLINGFEHLQSALFQLDECNNIFQGVSLEWLQQNICRCNRNNLTYRTDYSPYASSICVSIGNE